MIIRFGTESDLPAIDSIYNQAIEMKMATADTIPYTAKERESWFRSHTPKEFPLYVAEIEGRVVGYLTLSSYRPRRIALRYAAEISYFVAEGNRGQGIGSALLEFGVAVAKKLGYKHLIAILLGHNLASIGLLKKYGFAEWGLMPGIADFDGVQYDHLYYGLTIN